MFSGLGFKTRKQFLTKEFEYILKRDKKIQISLQYFINKITCGKLCNTRQIKLIEKAQEMVERDLDIFNILDKLKEIEKLKTVFLDSQQ